MAQTDRTTGLVGNTGIKVPCKAATTAAIVLTGEQTIDGVACVTGDRVLVKGQASSVDNGIYVVDTGGWSRAPDSDGTYDFVKGSIVHIASGGAVNGGLFFECTSADPIIVGTSALTFGQASIVTAANALQIVDSIAALKAIAVPSVSATYLVRGFAAAGDGGGGIYWWNSVDVTADNGGSIIQLNAGGAGHFNKLF